MVGLFTSCFAFLINETRKNENTLVLVQSFEVSNIEKKRSFLKIDDVYPIFESRLCDGDELRLIVRRMGLRLSSGLLFLAEMVLLYL
ncbi:hypothetical protein Tco_1540748 [Tanacetum coccineum]